jgi:hypothetical protein
MKKKKRSSETMKLYRSFFSIEVSEEDGKKRAERT